MKKNVILTTLVCLGLFLTTNISQASPHHHGPQGGPLKGHQHNIHRPPMSPHYPNMHRPPMHPHHGHHLRRNIIYANYGWYNPYFSWNVGGYYPYYRGNYVSFGFGF